MKKMRKFILDGKWQAEGVDQNGAPITFTGVVPGCVHTDLSNEGILPADFYWRDNAKLVQWIENGSWVYRKTFPLTKEDAQNPGAVLVFEGLDVYCDVYLNGKHLGFCDDMFIPHRFPAAGKLLPGENTVEVRFYSPIDAVRGKKKLPAAFTSERLHTRRMQCTYGWDWVYRFVTCGIFRSVYLAFETGFRAEAVYIVTENLDRHSAQISCDCTFAGFSAGGNVRMEIFAPDGTRVASDEFFTSEPHQKRFFDIGSPHLHLWNPAERGCAPLYTLRVTCGGDEVLTQRFGIRTVKLLQLTDEPGSREYNLCEWLKTDSPSADRYDANERFSCFHVVINGEKIFCRGANWVPCEPFPSAESHEKITKILELAKRANVNMIRVWGGGLFECDHFYDECDRLGIMVTQDFLMACGAYPEDDAHFVDLLHQEAEHAALRLRNHPCIVWWTGDNENAVEGNDKMPEYRGRISAHKAIAPALRAYDPARRFLPSSPYGGDKYASKTVGTTHNTQYLSYIFPYLERPELSDYKEFMEKYLARFVAEEPAMGACSLETLRRFMTDEDIFSDEAPMWYFHTQSNPGVPRELFDYLKMSAEKVLGRFSDPADRLFKMQYIGYEWIRITLEKFRRNQWFAGGIVYWMLNDCWPASSGWALIDYYCAPKMMYYAFRRCAADYMLSVAPASPVDPDAGTLCAFLSSTAGEKAGVLTTYLLHGDGTVEMTARVSTAFSENAAKKIPLGISADALPAGVCAVVSEFESSDGMTRDRAFYQRGALEIRPAEKPAVETETLPDGTTVAVVKNGGGYLHAVYLTGAEEFEDNCFSMLPGETRRLCCTCVGGKGITVDASYTLKSYAAGSTHDA